jgi:hypothetical protein
VTVFSGFTPPTSGVRTSEIYAAVDCPCCYRPLVVSWKDARPANDVLQDAFGCDPADLYRFFEPDEWLQQWELPLQLTWGTSEEWRQIAGIWRATRAKKSGKYLSLTDIERGFKTGDK